MAKAVELAPAPEVNAVGAEVAVAAKKLRDGRTVKADLAQEALWAAGGVVDAPRRAARGGDGAQGVIVVPGPNGPKTQTWHFNREDNEGAQQRQKHVTPQRLWACPR